MKALVVSLESFQKGEVPPEVVHFISSCYKKDKEPFIVLDESSKIKTNQPCKDSKKSKRTQAILQLGKLKAHRSILTGTFMSKTPVNAYDQMNFLCPKFFPESIFAFAEHYMIRRSLPSVRGARVIISPNDYTNVRKRLLRYKDNEIALTGTMDSIRSYFGLSRDDCEWILAHEEYTPFRDVDDIWKRIGDNCIRVRRADVLDMPPKVYKTVKLGLTAEQKKLYLQLQNIHCTDKITVDNGLKLYLRFQDICNGYDPEEIVEYDTNNVEQHSILLHPLKENPKLDALEEIIDDIGNEQVVVWCSRTVLLYDAKERLEKLGYTVGVYDGKIDKAVREQNYADFRNKKIQIFLANQASGAYGLDGLKEADYAVYLCNSYSVEHRAQSEDRIYRGNITRNKYIIDILFDGTCENRVVEALKQGKELIDTGACDASIFNLEV